MNQFRITLFVLFILFSGCVEHVFLISLSPENYSFEYQARGDKEDILNDDFIVPGESGGWEVSTNIGESSEDSSYYFALKVFEYGDKLPSIFYRDGLEKDVNALLRHPIAVESRNWGFQKTFEVSGLFLSRGIGDKYPLVNELILSPEESSSDWLTQATEYFMTNSLDRSSVEFNFIPIYKKEVEKWIEEISTLQIPSSTSYIDSVVALGRNFLGTLAGNRYRSELDSIYSLLYDELETSLDLIDDNFNIKLIVPGNIYYHNADTVISDTVLWNFGIDKFANSDFTFVAKSKIFYPYRALIMCSILVLVAVLAVIIRTRKLRQSSD